MFPAQKEKLISIIKLIITLLIFIAAIVAISFLFTTFFAPLTEEKLRYADCVLLKNPKNNQVDCFGCVGEKCKDAPLNWAPYINTGVGTSYTCSKTPDGCLLVQ